MLLVDKDIRNLCVDPKTKDLIPRPLISPFSEAVNTLNTLSYGLNHAGYDIRLANEIKVFISTGEIVNPKKFKDSDYCNRVFANKSSDDFFIIPANSFILGRSVEYFRLPDDIKGRCVGKSTYARCGIVTPLTPLEPGWEGYLTIEIANNTPCPAVVFVGEGICQVEFEKLHQRPETTYAGKKYNKQVGIVPARVL